MSSKTGWQCTKCTFQHFAPGSRCAMCGELRVSKADMANFILGKPIPTECTIHSHSVLTAAGNTAENCPNNQNNNKTNTSKLTSVPAEATARTSTNNNNNKKPAGISKPTTTTCQKKPVVVLPTGHRVLPYEPGPVPYDPETASTWIYPSSDVYEKRNYQFEISETAVNQNTLVSLPTGLGKTLIAAVVLYNYYRWFPTGKVLFLAPTVPLVDQQITACYEIMGIPADHTAILTGKVPAKQRMEIYKSRRVFFCTPQTIQKDLENDRIDSPQSIVCIVLDEAHKAVGDYAYCKVVELLESVQAKFRLLGLSATPGTSIKAIQQVITKLRINCIEARTDEDVQRYVHDRHSEIVVVKQVSATRNIQRLLDDVLQPILDRLRKSNALNLIGNATITPYCLIRAKESYEGRNDYENTNIGYFVAAIAFAQIRADLHRHGLGVVRNKLLNLKRSRQRGIMSNIVQSANFKELCQEMEAATTHTDDAGNQTHDRLKNNPKLEKLREILVEHFERRKACNTLDSTRAIVFSQFRDSVGEIEEALRDISLIRPRHFVGQGKGTEKMRGMKQEDQKRVIQEFRDGSHNVLVCTCIGEEGLDIGEVDLIINFDCLSSPIRMIQRVGRTGRKRDGRVVTLVSEGAEERTLAKSKQNERNLVHALRSPRSFTVTPSVPMFPQPPIVEERNMCVLNNFHMSQVDGAKKKKRKLPSRKRGTSIPRRNWKIEPQDVKCREQLLGEWKDASLDRNDGFSWPHQLRKRLLVGRTMCLGMKKRSSLFSSGLITSMLRKCERGIEFKLQHRNSDKGIESLFPLYDRSKTVIEPVHEDTTRVPLRCDQAKANNSQILPGNICKPPLQKPDLNSVTEATYKLGNVSGTKVRQEHVVNPYMKNATTNSSADFSTSCPSSGVTSHCVAPPTTAPIDPKLAKEGNPYVQQSQTRSSISILTTNSQAAPLRSVDVNGNGVQANQPVATASYKPVGLDLLSKNFDEFELPSQDDSSSDESYANEPKETMNPPNQFQAKETISPQDQIEANTFEQQDLPVESAKDSEDMFVLPTPDSSSDEDSLGALAESGPLFVSVKNLAVDETPSSKRCVEELCQGWESCVPPPGNNEVRCQLQESESPETEEFVRIKRWTANNEVRCELQESDSPQTEEFVRIKRRKGLAIEDTPESKDLHAEQKTSERKTNQNLQSCSDGSTPGSFAFQRVGKAAINQPASSCLTNTQDDDLCDSIDPESIVCAVCNSNTVLDVDPLILCDGRGGRCNLAVHVTCYSADISNVASKWFCDPCRFRQSNMDPNAIRCSACGATSGPLKRSKIGTWTCVRCPPKKHIQIAPRRIRRPLTDVNPANDCGDDDNVVRKKRREKALAKYVIDEADAPSDMSEDDDPDLLRAIEEEEEEQQDFINDSSQLGYTQDDLDRFDPDNDPTGRKHQAFDAERDKMRLFDTPVLNRRLRDKKHTWSCSQGSERSDRGLGNMHFIRSVLEHHRQGGDVNQIEAVYKALEAEAGQNDDEDESF